MTDVKFCGLTREADAKFASSVAARYAGVIFAGGPRELPPSHAAAVLGAADATVHRVGVFGADFRDRIPLVLGQVSLDVVQLHADPTVADVRAARALFDGTVWAAVRVRGAEIPARTAELFGEADAVVLDAMAGEALGGTGARIPWPDVADALALIRAGATLVLAGGLTSANVRDAIVMLTPDIVDVSSGVESAPGVKDHERMTAFIHAVRGNDQ